MLFLVVQSEGLPQLVRHLRAIIWAKYPFVEFNGRRSFAKWQKWEVHLSLVSFILEPGGNLANLMMVVRHDDDHYHGDDDDESLGRSQGCPRWCRCPPTPSWRPPSQPCLVWKTIMMILHDWMMTIIKMAEIMMPDADNAKKRSNWLNPQTVLIFTCICVIVFVYLCLCIFVIVFVFHLHRAVSQSRRTSSWGFQLFPSQDRCHSRKDKNGVILIKENFKSLSLVKGTWPDLQVLKDFLFEWKLSDNSNGNCAKFWNEFNQWPFPETLLSWNDWKQGHWSHLNTGHTVFFFFVSPSSSVSIILFLSNTFSIRISTSISILPLCFSSASSRLLREWCSGFWWMLDSYLKFWLD